MKVIEKALDLTTEYDLALLGDPDKLLFFDIETTGLSAHSSSVYLIGCLSVDNNSFVLHQFMAESFSEEQQIILKFLDLLKNYKTLVHFNGDTFDLKYLKTAALQYGLSFDLTGIDSIDLYKRVRKHKALFRLENYKQKTIEQFLGIDREDLYSGGELISVYESYTKSRDPEELKLLLLHNREDLEGLIKLLPVLSYDCLLNAPDAYCHCIKGKSSEDASFYLADFETGIHFPCPLDISTNEGIRVIFGYNGVRFEIPLFSGTLKYFYKDYKQYWYLPKEDFAVHKKLAQFVDKDFRIPAGKETAYTKKEGLFGPAMPHTSLPVFSKDYGSSPYVLLSEDNLTSYLSEILGSL